MEDHQVNVIVVKEELKSSDAIKPRYPNGDKKERVKEVLVYSLVLCLLLSIFPASKIPWFHSKFMEQYGTLVMDSLVFPVLLFQMIMCGAILKHPVNNTIHSILYIMLLSSVTSVVEVSFVSWNAAIVILISWVVIIATIANHNREEIYNVDIAVSNSIQTFISIVFTLNLTYTVYCTVTSLIVLLYLV